MLRIRTKLALAAAVFTLAACAADTLTREASPADATRPTTTASQGGEAAPPPPEPMTPDVAQDEGAVADRRGRAAESKRESRTESKDMTPGSGRAAMGPSTTVPKSEPAKKPVAIFDGLRGDLSTEASGTGGLGLRGQANKNDKKASRDPMGSMATGASPMELAEDGDPSASVENEKTPPSVGGGFAAVAVNPWVETSADRQSTFAIDVDTASYTFARRFLEAGQRPPMGAIRVEEFVNAFHYSYAPPSSEAFRVHLAAAPSPLGAGRHLVRVAVKGKEVSDVERVPVHLTFLVDVSGSMSASDKLPLAQRSLHYLVDQLRDDDSVALVTYAGSTGVVLEQTKIAQKKKIHDAIDRLNAGGGTAMSSGMELAYQNAHRFLSSDSESRVIVLSDGDANIGRTGHKAMLDAVKGYVSEGVTLSTVGFGTGNYQDHTMEQLANAGNGNYSYIDSFKAAQKVFGTDLAGTLQVIAKDVKIQVEWNDDLVKRYRLLGYENRDIADRDFRNDKVDAGEIGSGHSVTALYEVQLRGDLPSSSSELATVRVRSKTPKGVKASESSFALTAKDVTESFSDLDRDTRFAMALALAGEVLRGSPHAEGFTLEDAALLASGAADGPYAEERKELVALLSRVSPVAGVARR